jgi:hypothetical protein
MNEQINRAIGIDETPYGLDGQSKKTSIRENFSCSVIKRLKTLSWELRGILCLNLVKKKLCYYGLLLFSVIKFLSELLM